MRFLLADSFTSALARLPAAEARAVKTTVVDLQIDPGGKGLSFHRIDKPKDPNFWSVRVSRDLRLIVHKTEDSLLVAYVGSPRQSLCLGGAVPHRGASRERRGPDRRGARAGRGR